MGRGAGSLLFVTFLVSGCLATDDVAHGPAPSASMPRAAGPPPASPGVVTFGIIGSNVGDRDSAAYYVNASHSVSISGRYNEAVAFNETVAGNKTWSVPLVYGTKALNVSIDGPGSSLRDSVLLTRLAKTNLTISYCRHHPSSAAAAKTFARSYWVDIDARPSTPHYDQVNGAHIDAFTAHDQLELFHRDTKVKVDMTWYPQYSGFLVDKIDGAPTVQAGGTPFWSLILSGQEASTGMSLQPILPGDDVEWRMSPCT